MKKIKDLITTRLSEGITQTSLAKEMGVSQGTIYKMMETETVHGPVVLKKVAEYFNKPISYFFDDHENDPSSHVLPLRRRSDDPEFAPVKEKILQIWEWIKDDPEQVAHARRVLDDYLEIFRPKDKPTRRRPTG